MVGNILFYCIGPAQKDKEGRKEGRKEPIDPIVVLDQVGLLVWPARLLAAARLVETPSKLV